MFICLFGFYSLEDNKISKIISDLFINDGLENYFILKNNLNENCLLEEPWSSPKDSIYLFSGINSFWINFLIRFLLKNQYNIEFLMPIIILLV